MYSELSDRLHLGQINDLHATLQYRQATDKEKSQLSIMQLLLDMACRFDHSLSVFRGTKFYETISRSLHTSLWCSIEASTCLTLSTILSHKDFCHMYPVDIG